MHLLGVGCAQEIVPVEPRRPSLPVNLHKRGRHSGGGVGLNAKNRSESILCGGEKLPVLPAVRVCVIMGKISRIKEVSDR